MPYGPCDPRERRGRAAKAGTGPLAGPLPDIVIASGRKTVPYLRAFKKMSGKRPFTVFLKDPRTGPDSADFIWAPRHDRISGPNVMKTLTSPHRVTPEALAAARADLRADLACLKPPRIAVLVGGDSRHHTFTPGDIDRFLRGLLEVLQSGVSLMITTSRRTPEALLTALSLLREYDDVFVWDGLGENPYIAMLAIADGVITTADSVNMVGEAAAIGKPIHIFRPSGGHPRITHFLDGLFDLGIATEFDGRLEIGDRPPLDSTPQIAAEIAKRFETWRSRRCGHS